jgi:hypothetical protein
MAASKSASRNVSKVCIPGKKYTNSPVIPMASPCSGEAEREKSASYTE